MEFLKHEDDYKQDSYMDYTIKEFGEIISFLIKRASMRKTLAKKNKDLYDAKNYAEMLQIKIDAEIMKVQKQG